MQLILPPARIRCANRARHAVALLAGVVLLSACGSWTRTSSLPPSSSPGTPLPPAPPGLQDGPPPQPVDVSHVPDAVPQFEPLSRYGNPPSYEVEGRRYYLLEDSAGYIEQGTASWYGSKFHGRRTSSGEPYDMYAMTAAHKTLPIPAYAEVTNLDNGRKVVVKINDRGPFRHNRLIDLSYAAAHKLDIYSQGTGRVEVRVLDPRASVATAPAPATESSDTPGTIYLQVGAYSERGNAERMVQRLSPLDGVANIRINEAAPGSLYRVRVGPFSDAAAVDRASERLVRLGVSSHIVVD